MPLTSLRLASAVLSTAKETTSPGGTTVTAEELRAAFSQLGRTLTPDERAFLERTAARRDLSPEAKAEAQSWLGKRSASTGTSEAVAPRDAIHRLVDVFADADSPRGRTLTRGEASVIIDTLTETPSPETALALHGLKDEVHYLGPDVERGVAPMVEDWFGVRSPPRSFERAFDTFLKDWGTASVPGISRRRLAAVSLEGTSLDPASVAVAVGGRHTRFTESVASYVDTQAHGQPPARVAQLQRFRAFLDRELPDATVFHTGAGVFALSQRGEQVVGVRLT